ncbi:hypothetical protein ACU686_16575 [Yinghuangia aomiensis]
MAPLGLPRRYPKVSLAGVLDVEGRAGRRRPRRQRLLCTPRRHQRERLGRRGQDSPHSLRPG